MAYKNERASKINHQDIIENKKVQDYLAKCERIGDIVPLEVDSSSSNFSIKDIANKFDTNIERIVAIDGGYQETNINDKHPSQRLCFYNAGVITFRVNDLEHLEQERTINPKDLGKLEKLEKFNFVVPIQNIRLKNKDFKTSIRKTLFDIFAENGLETDSTMQYLVDTIKWLVFKEYKDGNGSISFACPSSSCGVINEFRKQSPNYLDAINSSICCSECGNVIYITDCLDLHTLVDEINGASPIVSYILSAFEVVLMLCMLRYLYAENKSMLTKILFIKDGPLALFSRLDDFAFKVVRPFFQFLYAESLKDKTSYVNVVGLDKSGIFVEHFSNIESKIPLHSICLPNLDYMRKYITGNNDSVFGQNTYFGIKMFVKNDRNLSFLLDMAVPFCEEVTYKDYIKQPHMNDFLNLKEIVEILIKLKCDMYDKSFIPIAMINKLVSVSEVPSKKILKIFSREYIKT